MDKQKSQAFLKELGIPANARVRTLNLTKDNLGNQWKGYSVLLIGVLVKQIPQTTLPFPLYHLHEPDETESKILQLWLQKITYADSPVYGEVRWHPKNGLNIAIRGLEKEADEQDVRRALEGLRLLSTAAWQATEILPKGKRKKGRTKGSELLGKLSVDKFKREYRDLRDTYDSHKLHLPTQIDMAEFLNVSRTTLYRFMKHHGLKWPPI
ncbi:MAG TPA: hypothetical protein VF528_16225 [Pyrinomonadaceae bacterium]|jgi:hypothetical protein